ncbi:hypothetical protein [Pedobacter sp.]|uniref:glycosyl-4,4'-diaponeurosporenoate acyltransferase CrtO family protein n=1 Tax=Pedobacter sp. TaxID=1411316 RepID=UPI003D7F58E8
MEGQNTRNQLLNVVWTSMAFLPILWFWLGKTPDLWLYGSLVLSLGFAFLPSTFYVALQLSSKTSFYTQYGIRKLRRFVQHGDFKNLRRAEDYLKTIAMYERFHYSCFIFFLLSTVFSIAAQQYLLAFFICFSNLIYNILPILLQQYNRLRIHQLLASKLTSGHRQ